jgi:hypothetical protein
VTTRKPAAPKASKAKPAKAPAPSKKPGRPSKYDPAMCETIVALGCKGRSKTQMASHLNIARSTFDAWLGQHDEFKEAWELADTHAQAFWETIGLDGIGKGHTFNDRAWSLQVRNRFAHSYKENRELELSGIGGAPISIIMSPTDAKL